VFGQFDDQLGVFRVANSNEARNSSLDALRWK
jgi:hypothetical protein